MTVLIRPLAAADRPAWGPLWQGYLDFYRTELSDDVTEITWARLLDPAEDMHCLRQRQWQRQVHVCASVQS